MLSKPASIMSASFPYNGPTVSEIRESRRRRGLVDGIGIRSCSTKVAVVITDQPKEHNKDQSIMVNKINAVTHLAAHLYEHLPCTTYKGGSRALPGMLFRFAQTTAHADGSLSPTENFDELCAAMKLVDESENDTSLVYATTSNALEALIAFCNPHALSLYNCRNEPFLQGIVNESLLKIAVNERLLCDSYSRAYEISPDLHEAMLSYAACFIGDESEEQPVEGYGVNGVATTEEENNLVEAATQGGDLPGRVALARHFALLQQLYKTTIAQDFKPPPVGIDKQVETNHGMATYYMGLLKQVFTPELSLDANVQSPGGDECAYVYEMVRYMHTSHWFLKTASSVLLFNMLVASTVGEEDAFIDRCSLRRRDDTVQLELEKASERGDLGRVFMIRTHRRVNFEVISGAAAARFDSLFTIVDSAVEKADQHSSQFSIKASTHNTPHGAKGETETGSPFQATIPIGAPLSRKKSSRASILSPRNVVHWANAGVGSIIFSKCLWNPADAASSAFHFVSFVPSVLGYNVDPCYNAILKLGATHRRHKENAEPYTQKSLWGKYAWGVKQLKMFGTTSITEQSANVRDTCFLGMLPDFTQWNESDYASAVQTNASSALNLTLATRGLDDAKCYLWQARFDGANTAAGSGADVTCFQALPSQETEFTTKYHNLVLKFAQEQIDSGSRDTKDEHFIQWLDHRHTDSIRTYEEALRAFGAAKVELERQQAFKSDSEWEHRLYYIQVLSVAAIAITWLYLSISSNEELEPGTAHSKHQQNSSPNLEVAEAELIRLVTQKSDIAKELAEALHLLQQSPQDTSLQNRIDTLERNRDLNGIAILDSRVTVKLLRPSQPGRRRSKSRPRVRGAST